LRHAKGGGDVFLVLELPEVFVVGYDSISFTAKHFGGLRDIPAGAHFFWVAHPNGISSRCGVWIFSTGVDEVHVMQWDRYNEVLCESSSAEARIQADNVDSIHSKLVSYGDPESVNSTEQRPSEARANLSIWNELTSAVTETMLSRVTGRHHGDWFMHTGDRVKGSTLISAEVELDRHVSSAYLHEQELTFVFSQLSKTYSVDQTGSDRTLEATDATPYIMSLLSRSTGLTEDDIVGEFQFAFVMGVHLGNDSCVQQWWHMLLHLVLRAYQLPKQHPVLAASLLRTFGWQIFYSVHKMETSVLDQSDSQSRDLRLALMIYKRRLDELISGTSTPEELSVATAFAKVEAIVAMSPLDWDLRSDNYVRKGKVMMEDGEEVDVEMAELEAEDERGEWAPEVVELDELGREKGLVSWTA
jgi:A1 cistron-splicing factor AAR2